MSETTISVRVDDQIHKQMKVHDEINWSAVIRHALAQKLEKMETIDSPRAIQAAHKMDVLRKSNIFSQGKQSTELIREWREKRK